MVLLRSITQLVLAGLGLAPSLVFAQAPTIPTNYNFPHTYTNPLTLQLANGRPAVSCPDPAIYHQQRRGGDIWYLYCTGDPLNSQDLDANGNPRPHLITQFRSWDLIHWTYIVTLSRRRPPGSAMPPRNSGRPP
jgi:arabinan endo-1,5-alpha-L-arabinosidase